MNPTPHTKYVRKSKPTRRGDGFKAMTPEQRARVTAHRWMPLEQRFWSQVDKSGPGCWLWKGALLASGHGQISVKGRMRKAHHVALELSGIECMVAGYVVDHICRVRNCVNPAHLRLVPEHVNSTENNLSPWAQNKLRTHCRVCGNPLSGANLAVVPRKVNKTRHGNVRPGVVTYGRQCLTCYPGLWRFAVIPRDPPAGVRPRKPRSESARGTFRP